MKRNNVNNPSFTGQVIVDGVIYNIKNAEAEVCGFKFKDDKRKVLEIIPKITHFPVTQIKNRAFTKAKFEKLILPWSIEKIGADAFFLCDNLQIVESSVPNSFEELNSYKKYSWRRYPETYVGEFAFAACPNLQSVNMFQYLSCPEKKTFRGCTNLRHVSLLSTVRNGCFEECDNLTTWNLSKYADISPGSLSGNLSKIRCTYSFGYSSSWSSVLEVFQRLIPWGNNESIIVTTPSQKFYERLCNCGIRAELTSVSELSALERFAICMEDGKEPECKLEEMFNIIHT